MGHVHFRLCPGSGLLSYSGCSHLFCSHIFALQEPTQLFMSPSSLTDWGPPYLLYLISFIIYIISWFDMENSCVLFDSLSLTYVECAKIRQDFTARRTCCALVGWCCFLAWIAGFEGRQWESAKTLHRADPMHSTPCPLPNLRPDGGWVWLPDLRLLHHTPSFTPPICWRLYLLTSKSLQFHVIFWPCFHSYGNTRPRVAILYKL